MSASATVYNGALWHWEKKIYQAMNTQTTLLDSLLVLVFQWDLLTMWKLQKNWKTLSFYHFPYPNLIFKKIYFCNSEYYACFHLFPIKPFLTPFAPLTPFLHFTPFLSVFPHSFLCLPLEINFTLHYQSESLQTQTHQRNHTNRLHTRFQWAFPPGLTYFNKYKYMLICKPIHMHAFSPFVLPLQ